jgi:hypothetical protein
MTAKRPRRLRGASCSRATKGRPQKRSQEGPRRIYVSDLKLKHPKLAAELAAIGRPLQESVIRDLQQQLATIVEPLRAEIGASFGQQLRKIAVALEESLERFPHDDARRTYAFLASRGWLLSPNLPWWDADLAEMAKEGDDIGVDAYMAASVEESLHRLPERVARRHAKRRPILADAMWAHEHGRYTLSVPTLLAQADGVAWDEFQAQAFSRSSTRSLSGALERRIDLAASTTAFARYTLNYLVPVGEPFSLADDTATVARRRVEDPGYGPLNRHAVLHGLDSDYGTRENSLRAFVAVDYMCWLPDLIDHLPKRGTLATLTKRPSRAPSRPTRASAQLARPSRK